MGKSNLSFIGQFVQPQEGEVIGKRGLMGKVGILASCNYHYIRVHGNLVQHSDNNKTIVMAVYLSGVS